MIPDNIYARFCLFKITVLTRIFTCVYVSIYMYHCVRVCFHCTKSSAIKQEGATSLMAKFCPMPALHWHHLQIFSHNTQVPKCLPRDPDLIRWGWDLGADFFLSSPGHYNVLPGSPSTDLGQPPRSLPALAHSQPHSLHNFPLTQALALLSVVLTLALPQASASGIWHPL